MKIDDTYVVIDKIVAIREPDRAVYPNDENQSEIHVYVGDLNDPFVFGFATKEEAQKVYDELEYRLDSRDTR